MKLQETNDGIWTNMEVKEGTLELVGSCVVFLLLVGMAIVIMTF